MLKEGWIQFLIYPRFLHPWYYFPGMVLQSLVGWCCRFWHFSNTWHLRGNGRCIFVGIRIDLPPEHDITTVRAQGEIGVRYGLLAVLRDEALKQIQRRRRVLV